MKLHLAIVTAALLATVPALAQTNGASPRDSKACAPGAASNLKMPDTPTPQAPKMPNETTGSGGNLSDKLAASDGVLCPPNVGKMPVIPPPGSPGGDPNVQPK